ncbi:MAG: hypothetical protein J5I90_07410 [Caldilineales bacterium]|nr:hypothetical protein [Caldilineales bacterium]
MKPLILWARDKHPEPYALRMGARDDETVRGQVRISDEWHDFVYDRKTMTITILADTENRTIQLNEWGWEQ